MQTVLYIVLGLIILAVVIVFFLFLLAVIDIAGGKNVELDYYDDDDVLDEDHHIRPLLGVVNPKEKK